MSALISASRAFNVGTYAIDPSATVASLRLASATSRSATARQNDSIRLRSGGGARANMQMSRARSGTTLVVPALVAHRKHNDWQIPATRVHIHSCRDKASTLNYGLCRGAVPNHAPDASRELGAGAAGGVRHRRSGRLAPMELGTWADWMSAGINGVLALAALYGIR